MRVLALCTYPLEAASTRYRVIQYISPLAEKKIELTVNPFLSNEVFSDLYKPGNKFQKAVKMFGLVGRRFFDSTEARDFDAIFVQREAMLFGPPVFEWLAKTIGKCPLILDLDDATYIRYVSPTYGKLGSAVKFFGKTDKLIDWSAAVICGNRFIADYVKKRGKKAVVVPTIVDTDKFFPVEKNEKKIPVIGWIGTYSTFPFLESLFPVFTKLAEKYEFIVKIVGAGKSEIDIKGVRVENLEWSLEREITDFQSLDIGLYPMQTNDFVNEEWLMGKSGFKAIQYMSVGIPFVVTPVGITGEIGIENETHFTAINPDQWFEKLATFLESDEIRRRTGKNGRDFALKHFTVSRQSEIIAETIQTAVDNYK